jgi:hypothetical protein
MQVTTQDQVLGNEIESQHIKKFHPTTHHHQETRDHTHHLQETQEQMRMSRPHEAVIMRNLLAQEQAYLVPSKRLT